METAHYITLAAEDPDATLRIRPETYLHFGFPWAGTKDRRCPRSYRRSKVGQLRAGTLHWLRNLGIEMAIALQYSACHSSIAVRCRNAGQPRSGPVHAQYKKDKLLYKKCITEQQVAETSYFTNDLYMKPYCANPHTKNLEHMTRRETFYKCSQVP